jgi:hypothetical protein
VAAKEAHDAAAAAATAANQPVPLRTGFVGAAARSVAAAAADDWFGAFISVPDVLELIVATFVSEGVQLRRIQGQGGRREAAECQARVVRPAGKSHPG